ncbi:DUF2249 domain-containing protein [Jatrophihabitans cynanchi]|jgi:uncharacterized protein (DUF2249 family)|uniref:DUF2249 domain-containing protein n=1 Tax=Jatrophihabitans cynanchi TaxID=2944128 RepID=A0ABY7K464_9ACTN|nr:DUF2249 domain-containing protein [Jatrophihabitans sp. SB3-54]WAX58124.1 DUF2249 domain-containing protein [Jatrophihabitans sp. SB3-54]
MPAPSEQVVDTRLPGSDSCVNLTNAAVDELRAGSSFVLVADHDPIGLCYMLDAERPGAVSWQPLEQGPAVWRVRFSKPAAG